MADAGRNLCPFVQSWHQDWLQCNLLQELKSFSDRSIPVLAASRSGAHVDRLWSWREADGWQSLFGVMSCFFGNALCWDHSHRSTKRLLIYSFELGVSRIKYYVRLRCFWSLLWGFPNRALGPVSLRSMGARYVYNIRLASIRNYIQTLRQVWTSMQAPSRRLPFFSGVAGSARKAQGIVPSGHHSWKKSFALFPRSKTAPA